MSYEDRKQHLAGGSVQCPKCQQLWAWLGDQGCCVGLFGKCLSCLLNAYTTPFASAAQEQEADEHLGHVVALRRVRERFTGKRVFPCINHTDSGCVRCGGRGWILGTPPTDEC